MNLKLQQSTISQKPLVINITGSKSETNRLLLLQALYPEISIENVSNSDDSEVMLSILQKSKIQNQESNIYDVHHAGTTMRFLTAYFAQKEELNVVLTGSNRMKERPLTTLVFALEQLGASIEYIENDGFPPIKIIGKKLTENKVYIPANLSSQYISALLLIAPKLENGLELILMGEITSLPYLKMTLAMLNKIGVETKFEKNVIKVQPKLTIQNIQFIIESDWSSASYWFSIIALSPIGTTVSLSSFKENSLQGDTRLIEIYKNFGIKTEFNNNLLTITKENNSKLETLNINLNNCPDIAQTIAVTCLGLSISCKLTGLHTLKFKETNRLKALKNEFIKLGAKIEVTKDSLFLEKCIKINPNISIKTYNDHRMAMAFAPLALKTSIQIKNAEVVSKSYPTFWSDLKNIGFSVQEI